MKIVTIFVVLVSLVSCAAPPSSTNPSIIGVYGAINRECNGNEPEMTTCNNLLLLEFVYGNFYQISKDEIAFVSWSGKKNEDLLYVARKVDIDVRLEHFPASRVLNPENSFIEFVEFKNADSLDYTFGSSNAVSKISFQRLNPTEINSYIMEYPGSD